MKLSVRETLGARFNRLWIAMWAFNTLALLALMIHGVHPGDWFASAVLLFFVPEGIGLIHRGDSLPPLTYAIRRYVPRWMVDMCVYAWGAFAAWTWHASTHAEFIVIACAAVVGWLTNHFDVTFDGPGE